MKVKNSLRRIVGILFVVFLFMIAVAGAYGAYGDHDGPYGENDGIHGGNRLDPSSYPPMDPRIKGWATGVADWWRPAGINFGLPEDVLGQPGGTFDAFSLGDGGWIIVTFDQIIGRGEGPDFVVWENGFISRQPGDAGMLWAEFLYVEVSSDGVNFARFPSVCLNPDRVGGFGCIDPTYYHNVAGKHPNGNDGRDEGTPFELDDLLADPLVVDGTVDLNNIQYVKLSDVIGNGSTFDSFGNTMWDPYPTPFGTGGSDPDAVAVINIGTPTAAFGAIPSTGTAPLTVQFTDTSTGDVDTWNWDFGDGETGTEQNPTHIYQNPGDYDVTLEVSGSGGNDSTTIVNVIQVQSEAPTLIAAFNFFPNNGTAPLTVQFTDISTGDVDTWDWDFGDGETGTEQNPTHIYQNPGDYDVTLEVSGSEGNDSTTIINAIQVQGVPPTAAFNFSPDNGTVPLTVQFTDTSSGNMISWVWDFGDGSDNSAEQNPEHIYQNPGTYSVTLYVDGRYGGDQTTKNACVTVTVPVVPAPHADFGVTPSTGTAPLAVQFTDASTGDIERWYWYFGDGGGSRIQNPSHTYQSPGTYTVMLTVYGPGGSNTKSVTVHVSGEAPPETGMAAPESPMSALAYATGEPLADPADTLITLAPGPIYLQPSLVVDPVDVGRSATVLLYVWLPGYNVGATLVQQTIILSDKLDFTSLYPQSIDLTDYDGLVFDIYYGYILEDGTIKYNDYEVKMQAAR